VPCVCGSPYAAAWRHDGSFRRNAPLGSTCSGQPGLADRTCKDMPPNFTRVRPARKIPRQAGVILGRRDAGSAQGRALTQHPAYGGRAAALPSALGILDPSAQRFNVWSHNRRLTSATDGSGRAASLERVLERSGGGRLARSVKRLGSNNIPSQQCFATAIDQRKVGAAATLCDLVRECRGRRTRREFAKGSPNLVRASSSTRPQRTAVRVIDSAIRPVASADRLLCRSAPYSAGISYSVGGAPLS
jgi:hypothetical protein